MTDMTRAQIATEIEDAITKTMDCHPEVFIRFLAIEAASDSVVLEAIAKSLQHKGEWMMAQAAGLEALLNLSEITGPNKP